MTWVWGAVRDGHLLSSLLLAHECSFSLPLISLFIVHLVGLIHLGFSGLASGVQAAGVTTPWGGKKLSAAPSTVQQVELSTGMSVSLEKLSWSSVTKCVSPRM